MLNEKSMKKLEGVNPSLVAVIGAAAISCPLNFQVSEGLRSKDRQKMLFDAGKSRTMNSKHIDGEAVDIFVIRDGVASWNFNDYYKCSLYIKSAAAELDVAIEWGGDWKTFKDGVHFQLKKGNKNG